MTSGDAEKLSKMALEWSGSKPQTALSLLKSSVALVESLVEGSPNLSEISLRQQIACF